jgi:SAM-dependent methyltransferase
MRRSGATALLALALAACAPAPDPAAASEPPVAADALRKPDVRYVPSPRRVVRAMLELAEVGANDLVYDLGSGDGRIPISAARDFGARAIGIDIDPKLVALASENARKAGVADRVRFRNQDLFEADFADATVVTLFLSPEVNLRLRPKLLAGLGPGTRVISHWHDMGDWQPDRTIRVEGRPLYLWRIPAR